jgi:2-phosphoglycerate kinase
MVYLIGGSSHVGKTLLAQKLMERTGYPYTSLDHLKMGFIRSGMTDLTVEDDLEMRYWMWPFVTGMIKTAIENEQNLILEGCYIPVEWQDSFSEEELSHIKCIFIVMSEAYIRNHIADIADYANVIEKRLDDEIDIERLIECSEGFKNDCEEYGVLCYVIDEEFCPDDILKVLGVKNDR